MIKKHEASNVVVTVPRETLQEFFSESVHALRTLSDLYLSFQAFIEGKIDEEEMYDEMDDLYLKLDTVYMIGGCNVSVVPARNHYFANASRVLELTLDVIHDKVDSGVYPDVNEAKSISSDLFYGIGGLAYFIVNEFGVFEFADNFVHEDQVVIDEIYAAYVKSNSANIAELSDELLGYMKTFKFTLDLFDEYPEYADEFERTMGPDYYLIPEGALTIEMVKDAIAGKLTPSELVGMFVEEE